MSDMPYTIDNAGTPAERRALGPRRPNFDATSSMLLEVERIRVELAAEVRRLREALQALREKGLKH